jgi:putative transposase
MRYNPQVHHRRSVRLPGYDYAQPGAYFVTIVTRDRHCLFGQVVDDQMQLNRLGQVASHEWERLARRFQTVTVDAFVVMPNHVHGTIILNDTPRRGAAGQASDQSHSMPCLTAGDDPVRSRCAPTHDPTADERSGAAGQTSDQGHATPCLTAGDDPQGFGCAPTTDDTAWGRVAPGSIPAIVRAFKSAVTLRVNLMRGIRGDVVWQRNYYEHIIRNDAELNRARQYIADNPLQWALDEENPYRSGEL